MRLRLECSHCATSFSVDSSLGGRPDRCPKCGTEFVVPQLDLGPGDHDSARLGAELEEARTALERARRELEEEKRVVAELRATRSPAPAPAGPKAAPREPMDDRQAVGRLGEAHRRLKEEIRKVIVGQETVVDQLLISIFSRGHCLLIGVPGLAKTMLISTLARTLNLSFNRIQFTPDLMPSDITGTEVIQEDKSSGERRFKFLPGPIFANVVLADEINRTPPKTQAALLEAMQEHQVSAGGTKHLLPEPFFVLATQNPIEQEGTYPLPEAQLDRFMFNVLVDYPDPDDEMEIMRRTTADRVVELQTILQADEILRLQEIVRRVPVTDDVVRYAMTFARMTRVGKPDAPEFIQKWLSWGAGPRASQYLILGAKARAVLDGRFEVRPEDVLAVVHPVLRHRILTNFSAEAEGITPDKVIDRLIEETRPETVKTR